MNGAVFFAICDFRSAEIIIFGVKYCSAVEIRASSFCEASKCYERKLTEARAKNDTLTTETSKLKSLICELQENVLILSKYKGMA